MKIGISWIVYPIFCKQERNGFQMSCPSEPCSQSLSAGIAQACASERFPELPQSLPWTPCSPQTQQWLQKSLLLGLVELESGQTLQPARAELTSAPE